MNTRNNLEDQIFKIEIEHVKPISIDAIQELFSILKTIDNDLSPILETIIRLIEKTDDNHLQTMSLIKVLKFYGFNNTDILSSRQKIIMEEDSLVKKPFLKKQQKQNIEIILADLGIEVI